MTARMPMTIRSSRKLTPPSRRNREAAGILAYWPKRNMLRWSRRRSWMPEVRPPASREPCGEVGPPGSRLFHLTDKRHELVDREDDRNRDTTNNQTHSQEHNWFNQPDKRLERPIGVLLEKFGNRKQQRRELTRLLPHRDHT